MALNLGARMMAAFGSIGQPSEEKLTNEAHANLKALYGKHQLHGTGGRDQLVGGIVLGILPVFEIPPTHDQVPHLVALVRGVLDYEGLFDGSALKVKPTVTSEHWEVRKVLAAETALLEDFDETREQLRLFFCHLLDPIFHHCPILIAEQEEDGIPLPTALTHALAKPGLVIEKMAEAASIQEFVRAGLFTRTRETLEANLVRASGGNPRDPAAYNKTMKFPTKADATDPGQLVATYLAGTPLAAYLDQQVAWSLPERSRFEHHHIVAGSGHGKTQTLQFLLTQDFDAVARGERSVVVIDSQGDLIGNISKLEMFAPGQPLHEKIVVIDPTDVEWPVSLNLFDVGQDRLGGYSPLEQERLRNSILELYDFVLGSLLSAEMTQKQSVIFRYVTRLMLHIPDATIHTLRSLMEPKGHLAFEKEIASLSGSARYFFETEFSSKEFEATKRQVLRRLWGILENQTFERMFSHPKNKLDLFTELNSGKIILINTAKDLLKESGTQIFGRFFIALIAQAAQERATLKESDRMPTMIYIDEANDYFDSNVALILSQARKYKVGMVLAHQYLGQLEPRLQEAFAANTAIKFAGGVSAKDARSLSAAMYCQPHLIEERRKGSFACYVRGATNTAIPITFPFGAMEKLQTMDWQDSQALQDKMRREFAVHYSEIVQAGDETRGEEQAASNPHEPTKGW